MAGPEGDEVVCRPVEPGEVISRTSALVDAWCERRCLRALHEILAGWPLAPLTDGWGQLSEALRGVRAFGSSELLPEESQTVEQLIAAIDGLVSP